MLKEEGLTREALLNLDPYLISRNLRHFHRSVLNQFTTNIAAEFILGTDPSPGADYTPALWRSSRR